MITRFIDKSTIAAALVLAGVGAAQAAGLYVGGNLGTPDHKSSGNGSGVGCKVYGGYQPTPNFAVENGFVDLGHIDDNTGKVDLRGVYVAAVGSYEFVPKWSMLGSAGVARAASPEATATTRARRCSSVPACSTR